MSLPLAAGKLALQGAELLLDWLVERKKQKEVENASKGLSYKDVAHIKAQSEAGAAHRIKR